MSIQAYVYDVYNAHNYKTSNVTDINDIIKHLSLYGISEFILSENKTCQTIRHNILITPGNNKDGFQINLLNSL